MERLLTAPGRADAPQHSGRTGTPVLTRTGLDDDAPTTRTRSGRHPASPPAEPPPVRLPEPKLVKRVVTAVLVGALTMFGVAMLDNFTGAEVPVLGTFASLPVPSGEREPVEVAAPPSNPGTCLNWTRPAAADATVVDCRQPHLFEQAGSVTLVDQTALPDDAKWRQLVNERCTPVVEQYLGGKFDPDGKFRIGALKPSAAKWEDGDRELRCGLQSSSRSGALYPLAGKAGEGDQSGIQEKGTCLAIDGKTVGDPVDCSKPHAVEVVGEVDLTQKFPDGWPKVEDQDAFLQPECTRIAGEYAGGGDVVSKKSLTVYWDNITEDSWKAGSRKVNCNLAALLPDRTGFAPVEGSVKGEVKVGKDPAPPATDAPAPGVPATTAPPATSTPPSDGAQPPADGTTPSPAPGSDAPAPPSDGAPPPAGDAPPADGQ